VSEPSKPFFVQALDALKLGDRRRAAALLGQQIRFGNTSAKNLPSVAQLAEHIGEIDLAIEATRLAVTPGSIDSLIEYWAKLAGFGREAEAVADIERQPEAIREHPSVLHFRGSVETQFGRFDAAQALFRRSLAKAPAAMATWFALAMVKTFAPGDPDIAAMERLERQPGGPPAIRASLSYALGKAAEDCGDVDRAFAHYAKGAALQRQQHPFDVALYRQAADKAIDQFTADNLAKLRPSGAASQRSLFVTGLPRSGTTLTEQILLAHSAVTDGAELDLFRAALIPVLGSGMADALGYQQRAGTDDPWGEIGRDYGRLVDLRFRSPGLVVDKSLAQSLMIGVLLHALPEARIAWLRRSPDDVALSCFRTYFSSGLPWTWSLTDIAEFMLAEDRLFEHWRGLFPDRILGVPYEELVGEPALWAERLQGHFGLPFEPGLDQASREGRAIGTASVGQVRQPISTGRIGGAAAFERHLKPFRDRYYG
jgi:tetratricopeptide (TPR) repeat protein